MRYLQLFKDDKELLGSDGIMCIDGRLNNASIYKCVKERNDRYKANFPHKVADKYAIYSNRIGSGLSNLTNI